MKRVYVSKDPIDAQMLKDGLEAEGIPAAVQGEALFGLRGGTPMTTDTLPTVWVVDDSDWDRARQFVSDYEKRLSADQPAATWNCPNCGETVEEQFSECWNCGAARS